MRKQTVFQLLLIAFLLIPVIEIYLLIQVGGMIGAGWTIFIVIGTAILGAGLLRQQGLSTWRRFNQSMAQGQLPPGILVEGIFLLLAGAFLLTPGFFTDTVGFLLLVPGIRKALAAMLLQRGMFVASSRMQQTVYTRTRTTSEPGRTPGSHTIEGEYERRDD